MRPILKILEAWRAMMSEQTDTRSDNINNDNIRSDYVNRRKRIHRIKKIIVFILAVAIVLPNVICVLLFVQITSLQGEISNLLNRQESLESRLDIKETRQEEVANQTRNDLKTEQDSDIVEVIEQKDITFEDTLQETEEAQEKTTHKVYFTFDDGPSANTGEILDILKEYDVKATFFVVGQGKQHYADLYQRIVEEGHTLGMHSYSHSYNEIYKSLDDFKNDFSTLQGYLYQMTGVQSKVFRFPGGSSNQVSQGNTQEIIKYLQEEGITYYDWNISSKDAGSSMVPVQEIVENSMRGIEEQGTSIILFHDANGKRSTVEALPIIIEKILALEDTVILPITEDTTPIQHISIS